MHPSVAAFARTLLAGTYISYDGDPLRDLTLTAFLDKFVQRKPKVCYPLLSPVPLCDAAFARTLLAGTHVSYDVGFLRGLTLSAFFDKSVQHKPKVCHHFFPTCTELEESFVRN